MATQASSPRRGAGQRFVSSYDKRSLLQAVAAVAAGADADDPQSVSQRAFDEARASAGHPAAPSAKQAAARFDVSWAQLLEVACQPGDLNRRLGRLVGEDPRDDLSEQEVISALRTAASRRDQLEGTLLPDEYAEERQQMLDADRRAYRHGGNLWLPTVGQIQWFADGGWDQALKLAGLRPRSTPALGDGLTRIEILELGLRVHGCLMTRREIEIFADSERLAFSRRAVLHGDALRILRQRRAAAGQWTPPRPPRPEQRPDYSTPAPPEHWATVKLTLVPKQRYQVHDEETCLAAMREFLAWVDQQHKRDTLASYRSFCRLHPGAPWPSAFERFGGWGAMRDRCRSGPVGVPDSR
jgi:hypothetical protein